MKKKILVLTRFVKEYEPRRLAEVGRAKGWEVDLVKYGQISLGVEKGQEKIILPDGQDLSRYDYIVPRAASKKGDSMVAVKTALLSLIEPEKILNGKSFSRFPLLGKLEQGLMLAQSDLPTVDFVSFGSKKGWAEFRRRGASFPVIVKGRFGSHGRTVRLVNDWEQFERARGQYQTGTVLVQPVVKVKQWYRCLVVGGQYLGQMRHRQKPKYGGVDGTLVKFNSTKMDRLKEICLKACKLFEADYAGLDVLWDEDQEDWAILEVNRTAQFEYFEKRTGIDVATKILTIKK